MTLSHEQAREFIHRSFDQILSSEDRQELDQHLARCKECSAYQSGLEGLESSMEAGLTRRWPKPTFSQDDLAQKAAFLSARQRRSSVADWLVRSLRTMAYSVAGILVVFFVVFTITRLRPQVAIPGTALTSTATPALATVDSTLTPFGTPTTPPEWAVYSSSRLGINLHYPTEWTSDGEDAFKGNDGQFSMTELNTIAPSLEKACEYEANQHPELYGVFPQIEINQASDHLVCLIYTALNNDITSRMSAIFDLPAAQNGQPRFGILQADVNHLAMLARSMTFAFAPIPSAVIAPHSQDDSLSGGPFSVTQLGSLTLEQYPTISETIDTPDHLEFNHHIPAEVLARNAAARTVSPQPPVAAVNALLQPFEYNLQESAGNMWLAQGDKTYLGSILDFRLPSINDSKTDFAMVLQTQEGWWLARRSGVEPWKNQLTDVYGIAPVFAGDRLISLDFPQGNGWSLMVQSDGETIFTYQMTPSPRDPVQGLYAWQGHWLLEMNGTLVMDGTIMNQVWGASEIFNWQLLDGKPFYFYVKDGITYLSYDGKNLDMTYIEVFHNHCCEAAAFNVGHNDQMLWFYARRQGIWIYAELLTQSAQATQGATPTPIPTPTPYAGPTPDTSGWKQDTWMSNSPDGNWRATGLTILPLNAAGQLLPNAERYYTQVVVEKLNGSVRWTAFDRWSNYGLGMDFVGNPSWSNDGRFFNFDLTATGDGDCSGFAFTTPFRLDLATGQITTPAQNFSGRQFAISPDNQWIAAADGGTIRLHSLTGGQDRSFMLPGTTNASVSGSLVWSPDSSAVLVTILPNACQNMWQGTLVLVSTSGSGRILFENDNRRLIAVSWLDPATAVLLDGTGGQYALDIATGKIVAVLAPTFTVTPYYTPTAETPPQGSSTPYYGPTFFPTPTPGP